MITVSGHDLDLNNKLLEWTLFLADENNDG